MHRRIEEEAGTRIWSVMRSVTNRCDAKLQKPLTSGCGVQRSCPNPCRPRCQASDGNGKRFVLRLSTCIRRREQRRCRLEGTMEESLPHPSLTLIPRASRTLKHGEHSGDRERMGGCPAHFATPFCFFLSHVHTIRPDGVLDLQCTCGKQNEAGSRFQVLAENITARDLRLTAPNMDVGQSPI